MPHLSRKGVSLCRSVVAQTKHFLQTYSSFPLIHSTFYLPTIPQSDVLSSLRSTGHEPSFTVPPLLHGLSGVPPESQDLLGDFSSRLWSLLHYSSNSPLSSFLISKFIVINLIASRVLLLPSLLHLWVLDYDQYVTKHLELAPCLELDS